MNPLLFPEVLNVVFDFIPIRTLYTCRLVSHTWNEEACSKLQSKLKITFNNINEIDEYNNIIILSLSSCENENLDNYNLSIHKLHPLSIYKFDGNWSSNPWQNTLQIFFNNVSQLITSLELKSPGWNLWDFNTFFKEVHLPNLIHLSFDCTACSSQKQQLLSISYNPKDVPVKLITLKSLEILNSTQTFIPWICQLLETNRNLKIFGMKEVRIIQNFSSTILESLLMNHSIQKLQNLHLDYYLTNAQLMLIVKHFPILQLQSLSFALLSTTEPSLMYKFLKLNSHALTKLHLEYEYVWEKINLEQFQFPSLHNLKHLSIKFMKGNLNSLLMNIKSTHLKTLTLYGFESVQSIKNENFTNYSISLEQLSIVSSPACQFYIDEICALFPTLKCLKLQGQLTNEIMHSIITQLKSLEEMFISPQRNYFSDEGLIGNKITEYHGPVVTEMTDPSSHHQEYVSEKCIGNPCICQLKSLNTLHLDLNPKLSNDIINGLGHCENLKKLSLKSPNVTDTLLLNLLDKLSLDSLTFHGSQLSSTAIAKAEEKIVYCDVKEIQSFDIRITLHSQNNIISCRVV